MKRKWLNYILLLIFVFALYFITARVGLKINSVSGFATLIWAPSGIALAALLILGYRYWPAITVGAFLINLVTGARPLVALGISVGNTLEPLIGAYLLNRFVKFQHNLEQVKDVLGLVLFASLLSTTVSATFGTTSLWLGKNFKSTAFSKTWFAWWIGDMLGILVVAPLILVWIRQWRDLKNLKRILEMTAYIIILISISILVFRGYSSLHITPFALSYFIFPLLLWAALRFGQLGSVTLTFVTSMVSIWVAVTYFHNSSILLTHQLLLLQGFIGITAVTFMILAAVVVEKVRNQSLQEKFALKTKILAQQRKQLISLNKAKDDFISITSHQLRTPATSVKQYTSMLLEGYAGKLSKKQRQFIETAFRNNEIQLRTIDLLLKVAQIDAGKVTLRKENVNLTLLINDILKSMDENFTNKNQKVSLSLGNDQIIAHIDKQTIRMALENLLDNASKYSPPGKNIKLEIEKKGNRIAILIKDNGVGIIQKDIKNVFKKYSRIRNPLSISVGGTGLGLYWARKIIKLHHGTITVDSTPNRGATFKISIPTK